MASAAGFGEIPLVDLSDIEGTPAARAVLADRVCTICHEVGFMVVDNHGVDSGVVDDIFDLMRRFFALDDDTKALIDKRASPHFRGWESVGSEFTNKRVDVREQIDIWKDRGNTRRTCAARW